MWRRTSRTLPRPHESRIHTAKSSWATRRSGPVRTRRELYPEPRQHFIGQPWIEGNSARCVMRMYWIVILRRPDDTRVLKQFGEYVDTCVKIDGRWMVEDRRIEDWPT